MRVDRVVTNQTCNQNCGFCASRRPAEDPAFVRAAGVRIAEATRGDLAELVLAGGEPTLRRDLATLVSSARRRGAARVVLETNAAVVDAPMASALAAAGLGVARVKIPAWGDAYDRITRDDGGFERMLAGVTVLSGAGIAVEALVNVVRDNLDLVRLVPAALRAAAPDVRVMIVGVPHTAGGDAAMLAPVDRGAAALEDVVSAARRAGFSVRIDPGGFVPPCLLSSPGRLSHLYALSPGGERRPGYSRVASCAGCVVRELCPGLPDRAVAGDTALPAMRPLTGERARRRLTRISSDEEQIARELVTRETHRALDGTSHAVHTVRINFRCNQACGFCFVSTHLPSAAEEAVVAAIEDAGRAEASLALSGGEPTLNPRLTDYVRLAKRAGVRDLELQTNATRLGDPSLVLELAQAGVDVAFVSLHGSCAEVSDRVTQSPGTFEQTVLGIDRLYESAIALRLNFVHCALNTNDFVPWVRMVAKRWPGATVTISVVAPSTDLVPHTRDMIPRYSDVRPKMAEGIALARELGLAVTGFESMCSVPLCLLPDTVREYLLLPGVPEDGDRGEFMKPAACQECGVEKSCWGIRRGYAELYGVSELSPQR